MKKNTGKEFEALVKRVFDVLSSNDKLSSVELNVELEGADGKRQIDVLIESTVAGISVRTIIEARDYSKRIDITHVDGLHSKMMDVRAHKAVLVSRIGFSKKARSKADRLGITLCTLNNPSDELRAIGLEIPIIVKEVDSASCNIRGEVYLQGGVTYKSDKFMEINGVSLVDLLQASVNNGDIPIPNDSQVVSWVPKIASPHIAFPSASGDPVEIKNLAIEIEFKISYLFGYVSHLEDSVVFRNLSEQKDSLIFNWPSLEGLRKKLVKYRSFQLLPMVPDGIRINGEFKPVFSFDGKASFQRK